MFTIKQLNYIIIMKIKKIITNKIKRKYLKKLKVNPKK